MDTRPLELFNQRAKRLKESRFLTWLLTSGNKQPDLARLQAGDWLAYEGLSPDDLDSFCLNLRLLIQDGDGYSIRCLSDLYASFPDDYEEAKKLFSEKRNALENFLESKAMLQIQERAPLSHRALFNIVFYGGIVHNSKEYYADYLRLTRCGAFSSVTFMIIWNVILKMNACIQCIAILNGEVMRWESEPNNASNPTR